MIGHLTHTPLQVHRPSTVADGMGGQTVTYTEAGEIRFQVNQPTTDERMLAAQAGVDLTHVLHAVAGADVRRGDELDGDLPSPLPELGRRLRVAAVISNSRSTYTRVECETVQGEVS